MTGTTFPVLLRTTFNICLRHQEMGINQPEKLNTIKVNHN